MIVLARQTVCLNSAAALLRENRLQLEYNFLKFKEIGKRDFSLSIEIVQYIGSELSYSKILKEPEILLLLITKSIKFP